MSTFRYSDAATAQSKLTRKTFTNAQSHLHWLENGSLLHFQVTGISMGMYGQAAWKKKSNFMRI